MSNLVDYLHDPIKTGVQYRKYQFNIPHLLKTAKSFKIDEWVENEEDEKDFERKYYDHENLAFNLIDIVAEYYKDKIDNKDFINFFNINIESFKEEINKEINRYGKDDPEIIPMHIWNELNYNFFKSGIRENYKDAICFYILNNNNDKNITMMEAVSLNKDVLSDMEKMLKNISFSKGTFEIIKNRITHSTRYVYRPYQYIIKLWLKSLESKKIHKDLRDLIFNASEYHDQEEWRTSVILCSIVTELILADVFEELHKKEAPDIPLGALFEQVKTNANLTDEIKNSIQKLNQIRISAVHRSKSPISDRDSEIVLTKVYKILNWYSEQY